MNISYMKNKGYIYHLTIDIFVLRGRLGRTHLVQDINTRYIHCMTSEIIS